MWPLSSASRNTTLLCTQEAFWAEAPGKGNQPLSPIQCLIEYTAVTNSEVITYTQSIINRPSTLFFTNVFFPPTSVCIVLNAFLLSSGVLLGSLALMTSVFSQLIVLLVGFSCVKVAFCELYKVWICVQRALLITDLAKLQCASHSYKCLSNKVLWQNYHAREI